MAKGCQLLAVRRSNRIVKGQCQIRYLTINGREHLGQARLLLVGRQPFLEFLAGNLCFVCKDVFQRAVRHQELRRCFRSHARYARNIVRRIPHQALQINQSDWR